MLNSCRYTRWERARTGGQTRFMLLWGVLGWGVTAAILMQVVLHVFSSERASLANVILPLTVFPIGGIFWGVGMWRVMERKYRGRLQESSSTCAVGHAKTGGRPGAS